MERAGVPGIFTFCRCDLGGDLGVGGKVILDLWGKIWYIAGMTSEMEEMRRWLARL